MSKGDEKGGEKRPLWEEQKVTSWRSQQGLCWASRPQEKFESQEEDISVLVEKGSCLNYFLGDRLKI